MSTIISQLRAVAEDLHKFRVPWALIGGLAVSVHAEPRTTRDIDIAVAISDRSLQRSLIDNLVKIGYHGEQVIMHLEPTHTLGTRLQVRGANPTGSVAVDLLFSSSGLEPEIIAAAMTIAVFPDISIPIACRGHLIAMKLLAQNNFDRLRDKIDLKELLTRATAADAGVALESIGLIEARGFSRGKELGKEYRDALKEFAPHLLLE